MAAPVKRRASFVGARGAEAAYAKLGPGSPREIKEVKLDKQEDELKLAAMECRVREMVLEVTKPTVERAVKLQNHCDHLSMLLQAQGTWLLGLSEEVKDTQSKVDIVSQFKGQMDSFWQDHMNLEVKFEQHKQDSQKQIEQNARHCQSLKTSTELIAKQFERTQEDADIFRKDLFGMNQNVDLCLKRCKDYCDTQMKQMDFKVAELKELQKAMLEEILGPENPNELSPPSLRRFDMQIRQLQRMIKEALEELRHMRLLDGQLQKVTAIQEKHEIRLTGHDAEEKGLKQSLDDLGKELRAQLKRTANLMAAYTSNLMHDVRGSFSKEVDALRDTSQDVQKFLKDTEDKVNDLGVALHGCGKHLEASLREVRTDLEGNDAKRKRDKQGLEESIGSLHKQVFSSKDTSEKMSKGLEHICSVIGMNLQGQRMGIALMVQDYVDRKEVQYVGIKKDKDGSKSERGTAKVIDLQQLSRLPCPSPGSMQVEGSGQPDEDDDLQTDIILQKRCRRLAAAFGFGQGCCVNIYLSAAGYFGNELHDEFFFVWMCACVYVTPLVVFAFASRFDPYFDSLFGLRAVFQVRLAVSMILGSILVGCLIVATMDVGTTHYLGVLFLGGAIGATAGSVASSSAQFFGVISPDLVPLFFLGQTASGAYVNVAAKLAGFQPGCDHLSVTVFYSSGVVVAVMPGLAFLLNHWRGGLEPAYRRHLRLTPVPSGNSLSGLVGQGMSNSPTRPLTLEDPGQRCTAVNRKVYIKRLAFLCQVFIVGLNISLTPLANVLAHGRYTLGQDVVLLKLLGDFIGRLLFFVIPSPRRLERHLGLVLLLAFLRTPIWVALVVHALSEEPLFGDTALMLMWVPFVVSGACGGSWCQVLAIAAVSPEEKRHVASQMNLAVYLGFLSGVAFAAIYALDSTRSHTELLVLSW